MNVAAVVPVEMGAAGLPLADLAGQPLIGHVLDRLATVDKLASIMVVTTTAAGDDAIAAYCALRSTPCFRGDPENALSRILSALKSTQAKGCALVSPFAPLIDRAIIDHIVNLLQMTDGMLDWVGTQLTPSYPQGMDVEAFTHAALEDADRRCADRETRREPALYLRQNSKLYRLLSVKAAPDLTRPDLRLGAEDPRDWPLLASVLRHFSGKADIGLADIFRFLDAQAPAA